MGYSFDVVDGGGYVARFRDTLDSAAIAAFWEHIVAERPPAGFPFGVIDVSTATIPNLAAWPGAPETLELLHPIARMLTQSVNPGFRLSFVSSELLLDDVIEDLAGLATFGRSAGRFAVAVRRHETLGRALAWCRSEAPD